MPDLYDTGAVLYRLSYQAIWELATFCRFVIYPELSKSVEVVWKFPENDKFFECTT